MEQEDILKYLNINKQVTENKGTNIPQQQHRQAPSMPISSSIDNLDEAVFGAYQPTESEDDNVGWDAKVAYNKMKESNLQPRKDINKSKIPSAILESVINNPLDGLTADDDIENFVNDRGLAPKNIDEINSITERLDNIKRGNSTNNTLNEGRMLSDNNTLEETISRILDQKLGALKNALLNENAMKSDSPNIKGFKVNKDGKFFFLASNDDLYECQMRYIGKNQKRKK